jgi:hypothetical protein
MVGAKGSFALDGVDEVRNLLLTKLDYDLAFFVESRPSFLVVPSGLF